MKNKNLHFLLLFISLQGQAQQGGIDEIRKRIQTATDSMLVKSLVEAGKYFSYQGENDSALHYFKRALAAAEQQQYKEGITVAHLRLGEYHLSRGEYETAMQYMVKGLAIAEKNKQQRITAIFKRDLGLVYDLQGDDQSALPYFLEAEKIITAVKDTANMINVFIDLTGCYAHLGDTATARRYDDKAVQLCNEGIRQIADKYRAAPAAERAARLASIMDKKIISLYNRINYLRTEAEASAMLADAQVTRTLVDEMDNDNFSFRVAVILTRLLDQLHRYPETIQQGEAAFGMYDAKQFPQLYADLQMALQHAYAATGNMQAAYHALLENKTVTDSLTKAEKLEVMRGLELRYETEKKDQQIYYLGREKKSQRKILLALAAGLLVTAGLLVFAIRSGKLTKRLLQQEKEIERKELEQRMAELEQTALRAQMNPHFIFNCLNSVQRFVIHPDREGLNQYLTTFASLIRQTLENAGKPLLRLRDEVKYLETYIKMEQLRSNNSFNYSLQVTAAEESEDWQLPGMVLQPYVENAILHGMIGEQGKPGQLDIQFAAGENLVCIVEDYGKGRETEYRADAGHQPMGTAITEKRIGLYARLYGENISVKVEDKSKLPNGGNGTRVTITFPIL